MVIGLLVLEFHIPGVQSLKEKRRVLKSIIERIKVKYNVSAAEVEKQNMWQEAVVGIAMICNEKQVIDRNFSAILRLVESHGAVQVTHISTETF